MQCYRPPSQFFVARWAACILEEMGLGFLLQKGCFFLFLGRGGGCAFWRLARCWQQSVFSQACGCCGAGHATYIHGCGDSRIAILRPHSKHAFRFCSKSCGALGRFPCDDMPGTHTKPRGCDNMPGTHTKPRGCLGKSPCFIHRHNCDTGLAGRSISWVCWCFSV